MTERHGYGHPPRDPYDIIGYDDHMDEDGVSRVPVRIIDRVEQTLRANAFMHDAAAAAGISKETLRMWRRNGVAAAADLLAGKVKRSDLDTLTRRCVELAWRMDRAEAQARAELVGVVTDLARGGLETTRTVVKVNAATGDVLERTEETRRLLPDLRAATWLLSHRYPGDFADRIEVTGPGGGPIEVESARDRLLSAIEGVRSRQPAAIDVDHRPANGNGHTNGSSLPRGDS